MRKQTEADRQLALDFDRAEQLGLLRRVQLPATTAGGGAVASATLKATLRAIDDHAAPGRPCWASQDTLAAEVGCSRRTIQRALQALLRLCVIATASGRWTNTYRIVWPELSAMVRKQETAEPPQRPAAEIPIAADRPAEDRQAMDPAPGSTGDGMDVERIRAAWPAIVALANRAARSAFGPRRLATDQRELVLAAAILAVQISGLGEDWLLDAAAKVGRHASRNPRAYLFWLLARSCDRCGGDPQASADWLDSKLRELRPITRRQTRRQTSRRTTQR